MLWAARTEAQLPAQVLAGHQAVEYNFLWVKNIGEKGRVTLFNFTSFNVNYENKDYNSSLIYQTAIYNLTKNWGIAAGGMYTGGEFVPQLALSYQHQTGSLYFNVFPGALYSPSARQVNYSIFGLLFFTPKLNATWKLFNQLTIEPMFSARAHVYSYQQVRTGLDYRGWVQFGLGVNLEQFGPEFLFRHNVGIFIRREL